MYNNLIWKDHVTDPANCYRMVQNPDGTYHVELAGTVMQQGTPQSQLNFNHMEDGIFDAHLALSMLLMAVGHVSPNALVALSAWEVSEVTLTNTQQMWPFNNSQRTISLAEPREHSNYTVLTEVIGNPANVGEIYITDKLANGFKLGYTGSAKSVTIRYIVLGGK